MVKKNKFIRFILFSLYRNECQFGMRYIDTQTRQTQPQRDTATLQRERLFFLNKFQFKKIISKKITLAMSRLRVVKFRNSILYSFHT